MDPASLGESIPSLTAHAVSVSLPTWAANIGYEEGEEWVVRRMTTGYPRFFIHKEVESFAAAITQRHGCHSEQAMLFPSHSAATRCAHFMSKRCPLRIDHGLQIIDLFPNDKDAPIVAAVVFPKIYAKIAKMYWQHTGEGISSRRAEYCHKAFLDGRLAASDNVVPTDGDRLPPTKSPCKGPKRYQRRKLSEEPPASLSHDLSTTAQCEGPEYVQFVEERFGRNLDISLANNAKLALRRRIAGALSINADLSDALETSHPSTRDADVGNFSEGDVYLFPCGMAAIFHSHQILMASRGEMKSVSYGFPYIDTLKILEKFGPGCQFYGYGSQLELDDLERRCVAGERFLALFCEFPGNPLLRTPDLRRIRSLADRFDFAIVIDETIGNFVNVHILPYADIVVSSLTKVFTGECNVMGGSLVLNPQRLYYAKLRKVIQTDYEDVYWPEDAIVMERNSRDFLARIEKINENAEMICSRLMESRIVKEVYYPKHSPTKAYYEHCRNAQGGYGGLLSVTFKKKEAAIVFFDTLDTAKGPSLGTNFTLSSPYVLLAHYGELDWAAQFGVEAYLVRISVGLEDTEVLTSAVQRALLEAEKIVLADT